MFLKKRKRSILHCDKHLYIKKRQQKQQQNRSLINNRFFFKFKFKICFDSLLNLILFLLIITFLLNKELIIMSKICLNI
jgi:hypothetical protein